MKLEDYRKKRGELLNAAQQLIDGGKLDEAAAKKKEIEALDAAWQKEKEMRDSLNALGEQPGMPGELHNDAPLRTGGEMQAMGADSAAYRNAFLKHISGRDDEMTQMENAAFTHTTGNTAAPLPTTMLDKIWDLVSGQHSILGDITIYRTGTILEVVKHTAVAQGKAKKVDEGAANDDEKNTLVKVTLSGHDFSKHVDLSYAEAEMSIDALESYLVNEIATSIGEAMAEDVVATIGTGVAAANKVTGKAAQLTYAEIAAAFGKLKRVGNCVAYMQRGTLFNQLVSMVDTTGRPIFQPTAQTGAMGTLLGATIKIEDAVADGTILVGDPKKVLYNMVHDIMIETTKDIKHHVYTYAGYARGEGALVDDVAFVQLIPNAG